MSGPVASRWWRHHSRSCRRTHQIAGWRCLSG